MLTVLVDQDVEGQAELLWGALAADGWLDLEPLRLVTFADVGLPVNSPDRVVWRFAQAEGMLFLTGNRNMDDDDSLERTLREESTLTSLPVITMSKSDRMDERDYRRRCAARLMAIVLDLDNFLGSQRLFIP